MTTSKTLKLVLLSLLVATHSQALDNGVPASEVADWQEVWYPETGSAWRTKYNAKSGELSFNPLTSEIWRNPANHYEPEAVYREEWLNEQAYAQKAKEQAAAFLATRSSSNSASEPLIEETTSEKLRARRAQPYSPKTLVEETAPVKKVVKPQAERKNVSDNLSFAAWEGVWETGNKKETVKIEKDGTLTYRRKLYGETQEHVYTTKLILVSPTRTATANDPDIESVVSSWSLTPGYCIQQIPTFFTFTQRSADN